MANNTQMSTKIKNRHMQLPLLHVKGKNKTSAAHTGHIRHILVWKRLRVTLPFNAGHISSNYECKSCLFFGHPLYSNLVCCMSSHEKNRCSVYLVYLLFIVIVWYINKKQNYYLVTMQDCVQILELACWVFFKSWPLITKNWQKILDGHNALI